MVVALDVGLHRLVLVGDEEVDPGQVFEQDLLDLLVDLGPRRLVGLGDALVDQLVDLRVAVAGEVAALAGLEVGQDELFGST